MNPSASTRRNVERILARCFTVLGGIFWTVTAFAGPFVYGGKTLMGAFSIAIYPLVFTIVVLALGWFYERFTALILAVGAMGTVAWGVIMGWESSVWVIMMTFFVAPTIIASVLFYLAGGRTEAAETSASGEAERYRPSASA